MRPALSLHHGTATLIGRLPNDGTLTMVAVSGRFALATTNRTRLVRAITNVYCDFALLQLAQSASTDASLRRPLFYTVRCETSGVEECRSNNTDCCIAATGMTHLRAALQKALVPTNLGGQELLALRNASIARYKFLRATQHAWRRSAGL